MACSNVATLVRFVGRVSKACGDDPDSPISGTDHTFNNITKVGGLNMGEEGTVEVPDWGTKSIIADGVRVLQPVTLQFRVHFDPFAANSDMDTLIKMFDRRSRFKYTWEIFITDRGFKVLWKFKFIQTDMKSFKMEDQELGQAKVGLIDADFLPYDVELRDCNDNIVIAGKPPISAFTASC